MFRRCRYIGYMHIAFKKSESETTRTEIPQSFSEKLHPYDAPSSCCGLNAISFNASVFVAEHSKHVLRNRIREKNENKTLTKNWNFTKARYCCSCCRSTLKRQKTKNYAQLLRLWRKLDTTLPPDRRPSFVQHQFMVSELPLLARMLDSERTAGAMQITWWILNSE